ncbi:MAG: recombination protein O N-terminal domain-containing protein [Candidatus Pacebacteria bacterium]|nr:recombination protein O N-terminal domain-containing protein [Candidatus Paceibacterota bacterium]
MSHTIYNTSAIVLDRVDTRESDLTLWLLTQDLGLVLARAQGARKELAKMRAYLQTLGTLSVSMVRGKYEWRVTGVETICGMESELTVESRRAFARIAKFIKRMTVSDPTVELFDLLLKVRVELQQCKDNNKINTIELLAVAKILISLGYMDAKILNNKNITKSKLTEDVNMAINGSHL